MKTHLLLGDVAKLLGVKRHQITYALANGFVNEPEMRIARHRVFQPEDVARLAEHFGVDAQAVEDE